MALRLIQTPAELLERLKAIEGQPFVAVDTEFIRETTFYPKMALIQIATEKEVFLVDPVALSREALQPLCKLLRDEKIVKIMHASYADQECFYWAFGIVAEPVLDTAVAAGLLGLGDNIGLSKLLKEVLDIHVAKGRSRVKWLERPLSKELLEYAEQDVRYLVSLGRNLLKKLESHQRDEWALELSRVLPGAFDESSLSIAERLGKNAHWGDKYGYAVFIHLVKWREEKARELNLPRHWVCDNDILLALAKVKPRSIQDLRTFRGLSPKMIDRCGEHLLNLIRGVLEDPDPAVPEARGKRLRTGPHENHVADLIQTYVYFLAAELEIVPRHLLTSDQAECLVENGERTIEEWISLGILTRHAARLIANDLKEILDGKKGLLVKNRKLIVFPVPIS